MAARPYDSPVRAGQRQATHDGILRATIGLAYQRNDIEMTLEQIAAAAGTTVRTVMRHFASRDELIDAAIERGAAEVAAERHDPGGDAARSIELLVEHYERRGPFVLSVLASDQEGARRVTASGRLLHRSWVESVFGSDLPADDREAVIDMLVVVTDVYAWKLLRLDRGLDVATTVHRIRAMTRSLLERRPD
jgi:AcrR family transcriptional regulator